jgi:hypothetical protein
MSKVIVESSAILWSCTAESEHAVLLEDEIETRVLLTHLSQLTAHHQAPRFGSPMLEILYQQLPPSFAKECGVFEAGMVSSVASQH